MRMNINTLDQSIDALTDLIETLDNGEVNEVNGVFLDLAEEVLGALESGILSAGRVTLKTMRRSLEHRESLLQERYCNSEGEEDLQYFSNELDGVRLALTEIELLQSGDIYL